MKILTLIFGVAALGLPVAATAAAVAKRPVAKVVAARAAVAKKLDLSAEQKAAVKAEREKVAGEVKEIRKDDTLSRQEKVAKVHEAVKQARADLKGTLAPAQKEKLGTLRQKAADRAQAKRSGTAPAAKKLTDAEKAQLKAVRDQVKQAREQALDKLSPELREKLKR